MASDLDEEMDEELDISSDINLLLPRSRPVRYNCHGSLVAESEHDESLHYKIRKMTKKQAHMLKLLC